MKENFLLFPKDREHPIKMKDNLPYRWLQQKPTGFFKGKALTNEYYTFQVAVFAAKKDLKDIRVSFSGNDKVTCFTTGGIDAEGKAFVKIVNVTKGNVQPLWFGVDIPETEQSGKHSFTITISPQHEKPQTISVALDIINEVLSDRGDSEPWWHSRLRWLNSRSGIDDKPVAPYTAMQVNGKNIQYLMGHVALTDMWLPGAVVANKQNLVKTPASFLIETEQGIEKIKPSGFRFIKTTPGVLILE